MQSDQAWFSMNLDEFFWLSSKEGERERMEEEISQTISYIFCNMVGPNNKCHLFEQN
jgi:hypothetical protein